MEEESQITVLIRNNRAELKNDIDAYVNLCFEVGKLYWYYYDYGNGSDKQITRAKNSVEWFQEVIANAPDGYANIGMATAYSNIGQFYRDITTDITEASDKGKYLPLFNNLKSLIDSIASDESESEIVRLELLEMTRAALQQYATKFKQDGITKADLLSLYVKVEETTDKVETSTDTTSTKKEQTISMLHSTRSAIESAYGTSGGGE